MQTPPLPPYQLWIARWHDSDDRPVRAVVIAVCPPRAPHVAPPSSGEPSYLMCPCSRSTLVFPWPPPRSTVSPLVAFYAHAQAYGAVLWLAPTIIEPSVGRDLAARAAVNAKGPMWRA